MKTAKRIIDYVGGKNNIQSLIHCATRLRFTLYDASQVDLQKLEQLPMVLKVIHNGENYQVVIGSQVKDVYQQIMNELGSATSPKNKVSTEPPPKKKSSIFNQVVDLISAVFSPLLPIMTAGGMLKALLIILPLVPFFPTESTTYDFLAIVADTPFYFLPVLVAYTSAKKFNTDSYLAMAVGVMLLHPNFSAFIAAGESVTFFSLPVTLLPYGNSVFPAILSVYLLSYINRWVEKISPKTIQFFFQPLMTLLIMAPLVFVVIGPLGTVVGSGLAKLIYLLHDSMGWVAIMLLSALMPFVVLTGMQKAFIPVTITALTTVGYESVIGPAMLASNFAQGAAALAVYFVIKDQHMKQLAASSSLTALLAGVTEPAMYGVNLKLKYPMLAAVIGSGCAGIFIGLADLKGYAYGIPSILSMGAWIGDKNYINFQNAIIGALIAVVVTIVLTILFAKRTEKIDTRKGKG